jgi:Fe-S-cluster containining protein
LRYKKSVTGSSSNPAASDICTKCGMCCNGTLFDYGELREDEVAAAASAGLTLSDADGKARFLQPCSRFAEMRCVAYEVRPSICRSYRCKLLKGVEAGEISGSQALARVAEARDLVARVGAELPPGDDLASARNAWAKAHKAAGTNTGPVSNPGLTLALFMLNRFLDRHFRSNHQRMMSTWEMDGDTPDEARPAPLKAGRAPPS